MQLKLAPAIALVLATAGVARADGELVLRGAYYKEKATRVVQPMMDGRFDAGDNGVVDAHFLVDAITSASSAATIFDEKRLEGGGGYTHTIDNFTLGGSLRYSNEPDYVSYFATVRGAVELFDRNFTLGGAVSSGHDEFDDSGAMPMQLTRGELDTFLVSLNASQLLSPNLVAGVTYDLGFLDGDQENFYRSEIIAGMLYRENHPARRTRHAIAGSLKWFVPSLTTTMILSYRQYHDSWTVNAGTPELRVIKDVGDSAWFEARYRYHGQSAAFFFEERYPMLRADELVTDDTKLSAFESHTLGAQLEVLGEGLGFTEGRAAATRAQIVIEYVAQDNDFGNAVVAHAALTIPFEY